MGQGVQPGFQPALAAGPGRGGGRGGFIHRALGSLSAGGSPRPPRQLGGSRDRGGSVNRRLGKRSLEAERGITSAHGSEGLRSRGSPGAALGCRLRKTWSVPQGSCWPVRRRRPLQKQ